MKSGVYPTIMEGVLLARIELGHISCRHMVKEYEGLLYTLVSFSRRGTLYSSVILK